MAQLAPAANTGPVERSDLQISSERHIWCLVAGDLVAYSSGQTSADRDLSDWPNESGRYPIALAEMQVTWVIPGMLQAACVGGKTPEQAVDEAYEIAKGIWQKFDLPV